MLQSRRSWVRDLVKWIFSIDLILPATLSPEVHSASNKNEYQKQEKNVYGVECGWCIRLTTLLPSVNWLLRQCRVLNISQSYRPPRPLTGIALMLFLKTTVRNNVFCAWFYYALLTTCFGPDRWRSTLTTHTPQPILQIKQGGQKIKKIINAL
jgi:hypothetical protein